MNIYHSDSAGKGRSSRRTLPVLLLLAGLALAVGGCADDYPNGTYGPRYASASNYGPGYPGRGYPGYGGPGYGGPGYGGPGYGYPGAGGISIEIGDRPYYNRGAGYYVGRSYYVWRPGHWSVRNGRRVWRHGHYTLRG